MRYNQRMYFLFKKIKSIRCVFVQLKLSMIKYCFHQLHSYPLAHRCKRVPTTTVFYKVDLKVLHTCAVSPRQLENAVQILITFPLSLCVCGVSV